MCVDDKNVCLDFIIKDRNQKEMKAIEEFIKGEMEKDGWNKIIFSGPWPPENPLMFRIVGMKIEDSYEKNLQALKKAFEVSPQKRGKLVSDFELLRLKRHLNQEAKVLNGGVFVYTGEEIKPESEEEKDEYIRLEKQSKEANDEFRTIQKALYGLKEAILFESTAWFIRCPCGKEEGAYFDKPIGTHTCRSCGKEYPIILELKKGGVD
jgi:hypothetical protein